PLPAIAGCSSGASAFLGVHTLGVRRGLGFLCLVALLVGGPAVSASAHLRHVHISGGMASVPTVDYGVGNAVTGFSGTFTSDDTRCADNRSFTVSETSTDTNGVPAFFASGVT